MVFEGVTLRQIYYLKNGKNFLMNQVEGWIEGDSVIEATGFITDSIRHNVSLYGQLNLVDDTTEI